MPASRSLDRDSRQQLLLVAIPPLLLSLLIAGLAYFYSEEQDSERLRLSAEKDLVALQTALSDSLSVPLRDLSGTARSPLVNEALGTSDPVARRDLIASALYPLVYQNPAYFQVRWVRASGIEGVRVDREPGTDQITRTPPQQLQNKQGRDYHAAVMALPPYHMYLSPPNLNREFGEIERPLRPTVRAAVRLPPTRGQDNGYLIVNVSLTSILARDQLSKGTNMDLYIARPDGDWILHPSPGHTWASELGHEQTLATSHPQLWEWLQGTQGLATYHYQGRWFAAPVAVNGDYAGRLSGSSGLILYLMLREPASLIDSRSQEALREALLTLLVLVTGTLLFLFPYARRLRQSIALQQQTQAQAETLARKNREIEALNRQLEQRSQRAEGAARAKSSFLANMSHEIRTPMNAILGLLEILETSGLEARQREQVSKIQNAARSLLQILNDILDLSKLEAGKYRIVSEPFALEDVVRQSTLLFQPGFDAKGVALEVWFDPELPWCVLGDGHRLAQVLNNLLGNALKFTTHGSVNLSVTRTRIDGEQIEVTFTVSDTGIGIPREKQDSLFEAFEQADASTTREFGGSGLGLAICQTLLQAMGGQITVDSAVGRGTEFRFSLPFRVASDKEQDQRKLGLRKVLVAESHARSARLIEACLATWNVQGVIAETAEEAARLFLAAKDDQLFDAIVVEWRLPDRDGLWLLESISNYLQEFSASPKRMVMLVSSTDTADVQERLARQRELVPSLLTKPITPSALFDALHQTRATPANLSRTAPASRTSFDRARVLLVEDNELNQEVALGYLQRLGVTADLAADGAEAVARVHQSTYDLVLMDQHMPGMDGLEACRAIRQQFGPRQLPIVAMTAAAFEDDILRSRAAGMNDHLSKPVSLADLESILVRWVSDRKQQRPDPDQPKASADASLPPDLQEDPALTHRVLGSFLRKYDPSHGGHTDVPEEAAELRHWLHDLKGTAATVGLHGLAAIAKDAETDIRGDDGLCLSPDRRRQLQQAFQEALPTVRQWWQRTAPPPGEADASLLKPTLVALEERLSQSLVPTDAQLAALSDCVVDPEISPLKRRLLASLEEFRFEEARGLVRQLLALL